MEENTNTPIDDGDIYDDITYLTEKRDDALEHLNERVKVGNDDATIQRTLASVLRINKQLKMLEDVNNIQRITGEKKLIFKIDVGQMPDDEIEDYIKEVATKFKKGDLPEGVEVDNLPEYFLPIREESIMDDRLKDVNLVSELKETMADVELQLHEDEGHWGDTWKHRGLVWNGMAQEERFIQKMQDYIVDWRENGTPVNWDKVIGEAHICKVREKKLK